MNDGAAGMNEKGGERQARVPAESESQTLRALAQMRDLLLRGEFKPGERIREIPLAARLNVSRTPLRLVLDRLGHEGLLEVCPKGGFIARQFTIQDILDAIEVRGVLEGTAARLAAERLESRSELRPMLEIIAEIDALIPQDTKDPAVRARFLNLNVRFHAELLKLAKSPMLQWSFDRMLTLPFASPNAFISDGKQDEGRNKFLVAQSQHRAIAEAIGAREGARAEAIAREHARIARVSLDSALEAQRVGQFPGGSLIGPVTGR
jgi:GntR family transcriptional regulator of vanillate catabolism